MAIHGTNVLDTAAPMDSRVCLLDYCSYRLDSSAC